MSTRGYLLFRTRWNGPYEAYYQHHDTYPTGLGISLVEVLKTTAHMEGKITPEKIVQELNSMGYNLQKAQRTLSKPEQAFQIQSDIEWIYAVTIDDTPESSSLAIYKTSNLHTNVDFCFKAWSSILRYFPSSHEIPREMHQLEQSANITLHAIGAYEEATSREKPEMPQLQPL